MSQGPIIRDSKNIPIGLMQVRIHKSAPYIAQTGAVLTETHSIGGLAKTDFMNSVEFKEIVSGFPEMRATMIPIKESFNIECAFREFSPLNFALAKGLDPFADVDATIAAVESQTAAGTTSVGPLTVDNLGGVINEEWMVTFTSATTFKVFGKATGFVGEAANLTTEFSPANAALGDYFAIPANFFTGTWAEDDTFTFRTTAFADGDNAFATPYVGTIGFGAMAAPKFLRVEGIYVFPDQEHAIQLIMPMAQVTSSIAANFSNTDETNTPMTIGANSASSEVVGGNAAWNNYPLGIMRFVTL